MVTIGWDDLNGLINWDNYGGGNPMGEMYGEAWLGDDNIFYSKDPYGNVFDQYGGFQGMDYPQYPPSGTGPWYQSLPGQETIYGGGPFQTGPFGGGGGGAPPRAPNIPANYVWNPATGTFDAPGGPMGGGGMGGGMGQPGPPQYNAQWDANQVAREQLKNKANYDQQYLAYLQQQLAQQGKSDAEKIALERERVAIERELMALRQQQFQLEKQADEFKRGMQLTETLANPRNLVQSLMLLGGNPGQVAGYLQNQPFVQQVGAPVGVGQQAGWAPPAGGATLENVQQTFGGLPSWQQILQSTSAASGGGTIDPTTGRSALFPFVTGRKIPVQQTLADIQSNNPRVGVISSLAGFSGQNPEAFFGEFESFLPKGGSVGLPSVT